MEITHKNIDVNGISMHVAEVGAGPTVLFLHGFPELWYSWRRQMVFAAEHGYRAVAPDLRGYGDTTGAPIDDPSKFTMFHLVGDLIALLDAIEIDAGEVFVVGHDWGANVGWHLCLFRPDRVRAFMSIGVPYFPRDPKMDLVKMMRKSYGDDHYTCRFQEPGDMEAEFEKIGTKEVLKNFFALRDVQALRFRKGEGFGYSADRAPWLSEEELDYYVAKFEHSGFTGALNYYRALGLNWELSAPWAGAQVHVPVKFVISELDPTYHIPGIKDFIHKGVFKQLVPLLEEVEVIQGAAHFVNRERPDEINQHMLSFLKKFGVAA